jgi:hypothetical protein
MSDLEEAKDKVMMGAERKSMVMTEEEKTLTAYHEGGHAVVALYEPTSDPIHKATIIPRGRALGMVMRLPERDQLSITRENRPKFELEKYTKTLHVKKINHKEFLLEFFISKYPTQFDKKSDFFLSDIKKFISQPTRYNSTVDINTVSFVTNNTVGAPDFLEFEYTIQKFDKIVEFNEFYVVKFISEVTIEAKSIIDKFRNEELDEKYKNKEKR